MIGVFFFGLVVGFIGWVIVLNDVFEGMFGLKLWFVFVVFGFVGVVVGWLVFMVGFGIGDDVVFDWGGIFSVFIGVVIVLFVVGVVVRHGCGGGYMYVII